MAKQLTTYIKSVGPGGNSYAMDTNTHCIWEFSPNSLAPDAAGCLCFRHETNFCVPPGICCLCFEIWGGGGVAQGVSFCGISPPSGSGAYAKKTIKASPGSCYRVHSGYLYCSHPTNAGTNLVKGVECVRGETGNTWVQGSGLTNFCANAGRGSSAVCCWVGVNEGDRLWADSANRPGACYFGADEGARGLDGWVELNAIHDSAGNYFNYRQVVPYPGGLINKCGGHVVVDPQYPERCNNYACINRYAAVQAGMGGNNCDKRTAGWGSAGNTANGGSMITCGGSPTHGRVKIHFSCCDTI